MKTRTPKQSILATMALSAAVALSLPAIPVQAVKPPNDGGMSKGTAQLRGGDGVFGVTYTMQSGVNLTLLKAKYTLEPHFDYNGTMPMQNEKLFWLTFAVKSPKSDGDLDVGGIDFTLVDEDNNNYELGSGQIKLAKKGAESVYITLKPGQGLGQDPLTNELSAALAIPGNAKIVKIMIKGGRANVASEKVIRYNVAGYPGGSPKNMVAPLPKYAADPTDPTGATMLPTSEVVIGKYYPNGYFNIRVDSVTRNSTEMLKGHGPSDGKEWVMLTLTAKNSYYHKEVSTFEIGDENIPTLRDADGDKMRPADETNKRKAAKDDELSVEVEPNEEVTFRYFFEVPKGDKLKTVSFGGGKYGHIYTLDLSSL